MCSAEGCTREAPRGRQMCSTHRNRMRRFGATDDSVLTKQAGRNWIESHLSYEGHECLIWPFSRDDSGYARYGKKGRVCREICERKNGPPPTPEHQAAHSCGNGHLGCVNPNHLRWATPLENSSDKYAHGTMPQGERVWTSKVIASDIPVIREMRMSGVSGTVIGKQFGITRQSVYRIANGKGWTHIK